MSSNKRVKLSKEEVKKLEVISIIILILFATLSYIVTNYILKGERDSVAIYLDGVRITEIDGDKIDINVDRTFVIGDIDAEYNILEIKDKKIRCIDANCPDKICVKHGVLHSEIDNDMIICAPHRLSIVYE